MDSYLERLRQAISDATSGMSLEEITRRSEGKWSAAEILEHLYLTYNGTIKGFERCLQAGKPLATSITLKQRLKITLLTDLQYFPTGRKAPERSTPKGTPPEKVVAEVGSRIIAMDEIIAQCEERYGSRVRLLDHPVLGPLTGRQWRKFHWIHGRHHVKQIARLKAAGSSSPSGAGVK